MPVNDYGIYIRKIRKERNETLANMAIKMNVSISFLSALEVGKKTIPQDIPERISSVYDLSNEQLNEMKNAIDISNGKIQISLDNMNDDQKEVSLMFARKINSASKKQIKELNDVLSKIE